MRVISGSLKGHRLRAVGRGNVRPTSQRVREAVFDILPMDLSGVRVLDLYAGVGAMGIEAVSRGALFCVFVDSDHQAAKTIKDNVTALGLREKGRVMNKRAGPALKLLNADGERFDLVLVDPPYKSGDHDKIMRLMSELDILTEEAIIVVEHDPASKIEESYDPLVRYDHREYGKTAVSFYKRSETSS